MSRWLSLLNIFTAGAALYEVIRKPPTPQTPTVIGRAKLLLSRDLSHGPGLGGSLALPVFG
jgi:hypothetical protein